MVIFLVDLATKDMVMLHGHVPYQRVIWKRMVPKPKAQAEHLDFFQKQLGFEMVDFADREAEIRNVPPIEKQVCCRFLFGAGRNVYVGSMIQMYIVTVKIQVKMIY